MQIHFCLHIWTLREKEISFSNVLLMFCCFLFFAFVFLFFYQGFLSWPFTIHRTAGEMGGHFFNSSPPLPPVSQTLDINQAITAESSPPLHIGSSPTGTRNLWFPSASCSYVPYVRIIHYTSSILVKFMHLSQLFFHMLTLKTLT